MKKTDHQQKQKKNLTSLNKGKLVSRQHLTGANLRSCSHFHAIHVITSFLCVLLLAGACGSNVTNTNLSDLNRDADPRVLSEVGIHCSVDDRSSLPGTLVLDANRFDYDTVTIQNMAQYIDDANNNIDLPPLPTGFRLVNLSLLPMIPAWNIGVARSKPVCEWALQITNMNEQQTIQVSQIQMQIQAQPFQGDYNLVDTCSLFPDQTTCVPGQTGGGVDYTYQFNLSSKPTDGMIVGQPVSNDPVGATLQSSQTVEIDTIFTASALNSGITYTVTPVITLEMAGEQRLIALNSMKTSITLVTPEQLACYTLHGHVFERLSPQTRQTAWCL